MGVFDENNMDSFISFITWILLSLDLVQAAGGERRNMRPAGWMLIALFVLVWVTMAHSQKDVMELNSSELGEHQRSLVKFTHVKHADDIDCERCHHDYDKYGTNIGEDGQKCSTCLQKEVSDLGKGWVVDRGICLN
jgi:hypothetical protein